MEKKLEPLNAGELVRIRQLPVIEERLRKVRASIDEQTREAASLVCDAETVQAVKDVRAALNRKFTALENMRKAVKAQVLEPYERFEAVYRECVADPLRRADGELKEKIDAVEGEIKAECEKKLRAYWDELLSRREGLDFLRYESAGVVIDLPSARAAVPKKLMERLGQFVERVEGELRTIHSLPRADEILAEYRRTLDLGGSIAAVQQRPREPESLLSAAAPREGERMTIRLNVTDTWERLLLLRRFLLDNHYEFK